MEFGDDCKVKLESMDIVETSAFISFLGGEITRKREAIVEAQKNIEIFSGTFRFHRAMKEFYQSAIARHKKDITEAAELMELVSKDPAVQATEQVPQNWSSERQNSRSSEWQGLYVTTDGYLWSASM